MVSESDIMATLPIAGDLTYREWYGIIDGLYCGVQDIDEDDSISRIDIEFSSPQTQTQT